MPTFLIHSVPGFEEWKHNARHCLVQGIPPSQTQWQSHYEDANLNLFAENGSPPPLIPPPPGGEGIISPEEEEREIGEYQKELEGQRSAIISVEGATKISEEATSYPLPPGRGGSRVGGTYLVPRAFMELAQIVICHNSPERFALLYRIVWRLLHENRLLLDYQTDSEVMQLTAMAKAVRRDAYKIKAFLRFREIVHDNQAHFVAWYEPEHYTLELVLPFFQQRFKNMDWSILTPYRSAHWDGETLLVTDHSDKALYPTEDAVEAYWVQYFASIFNPARLKTKAMLTQMPKKYWRHMPETGQIESLIRNASQQVQEMISKQQTHP